MIDHETQIGLQLLAERENAEYIRRYTDLLNQTAYRWLMGSRIGTYAAAVKRRIREVY